MGSRKLTQFEIDALIWRAIEAEKLLKVAAERELTLQDFEDGYVNWQMVVIDYREAKFHSYQSNSGLTGQQRENIALMYEYACVRHTPKRGKKREAGESHWEKYYEYIRSLAWAEKRLAALERASYKCQLCGARNVFFEVHHNTYENLGNEPAEDLIVLCVDCHNLFHNRGRK
jgi:5-methylcytosine-specific restriction endonuclease McrA